jgi:hypothetical protein
MWANTVTYKIRLVLVKRNFILVKPTNYTLGTAKMSALECLKIINHFTFNKYPRFVMYINPDAQNCLQYYYRWILSREQ